MYGLRTVSYKMLYRYTFSFLLGKYLRVELLKLSMFKFLRNHQMAFPKYARIPVFSISLLIFGVVKGFFLFVCLFFYYSHVCVMVSLVLFSSFSGFLNFYFQNPLGGIFMKLYAKMYACLHFQEDRIYINFTFLNTVPHLLKC